MKRVVFISILVLALIIFFAPELDAQCAMCKLNVKSSNGAEEGVQIGRGLNNGILYLMGIPYVLLMFIFRKKIKSFSKEFFSLWRKQSSIQQ